MEEIIKLEIKFINSQFLLISVIIKEIKDSEFFISNTMEIKDFYFERVISTWLYRETNKNEGLKNERSKS